LRLDYIPQIIKRDGKTEEFIPEKIVLSVKVGTPADMALP